MTIEDQLAALCEQSTIILRELRQLRTERQHEAGRWGSRAEAAKHYNVCVDTIDTRIADRTLRSKKLGAEPEEERRDRRGRRIDRRRVLVWITGAPKTDEEIARMASEAR